MERDQARRDTGRALLEFQGAVFGALVIVGTAVLLSQPAALNPFLYAAGAGIITVITVITLIWHNRPGLQRFAVLLPLLDLLGIRLTAHAEDATLSGGALLLILPMIWIAYSFGVRGVLAGVALLVVTSPVGLLQAYGGDMEPGNFTRIVAYPLTLLILAGAAGVSGARIRRKKVQLAAQTALTEQAVQARDDLIEAVTHELRTPLTSILGNAELVLHTNDAPAVERRVGVIVRNAEQMDTILADLLLARSTGTALLGLHITATDVRGLIENCVAASRTAADARGVSIDVIASDTLWADVDPNRIRQVFDNLLTNAIKYNRVGGTVVVSETRTVTMATFAVTDTGCGIAPTDHARVFEPYYRTESARRSSQDGSGLGLGISRDIARQHGGDLRLVESSARGSRFELTLSLAPAGHEDTVWTRE
ncbi:His Kinase A (phospho-acceptor) domain-containing protein [Cryobacterium flavum]|uniref:histidine kinase n=1 Tax=Cryobacterium flavum TaxID=1424659 RepID=A0A4R8V3G7_9MICO|nr:HAMP domain-containing sensor histidine kinase [Cryobacterium flavum]TFB77190.1 HAMP domain-containing histidine kinase [Cryobacterium flavum]SDN36409.1 His Kinase A (phospho-acceptor) domain-containing protein [Cryobacterium flavum]